MNMRYYGQHGEDTLIEKYFEENHKGVCIDVGAAQPMYGNNTYLFETRGWDAYCIEANPSQIANLVSTRKNVYHYAVGSEDSESMDFSIVTLSGGNQEAISSLKIDEQLLKDHEGYSPKIEIVKVPVRTLNTIVEELGIKNIDFISIDTEGTELDVLKGFDIEKHQPKLFVIENNYNTSEVEDYLKEFGYIKDQRLAVNDFFIKK